MAFCSVKEKSGLFQEEASQVSLYKKKYPSSGLSASNNNVPLEIYIH